MKVRFWGVRGSIPVPSLETSRYGGNTSCVEVRLPGCGSVVFDCGTGARALGRLLLSRPERELFLFFTHFHMDHLFGFPFFAPIFAPSFNIAVYAPTLAPDMTKDRIARYLNGVFHPLRIGETPSAIRFDCIRPGVPVEVGPYTIRSQTLNHPGGACGYRLEAAGKTVVYITDTAPLSRPGEGAAGGLAPNGRENALIQLLKGADIAIFDTMFTLEEYMEKMTWGHSYPEYAVTLCRLASVHTLYLFHHAPDASDTDLDALAAAWASAKSPLVKLAREGVEVDLEG
jgi:phosphoribosyl 1,2-cyclic phosphodiesterase